MKKLRLVISVGIFMAVFLACRAEDGEKVKIESIRFAESSKKVQLNEEVKIGVTVNPKEAKNTARIEYSTSSAGIIEIVAEASSNDGVVFRAIGFGSTVITARSGGVIDYCDVLVEGSTESVIPYISVTESVLEIPVNQKRSIIANLQGGTPADNGGFAWYNLGGNTLNVDYTGNIGVFEGINPGSARVRISHPKAQYNVEVLVFVLGVDETAKYITSDKNVVLLERGAETDYLVRLVGCSSADINKMRWNIMEGASLVRITPSGDSCRIQALEKGIANIRVTNEAVSYAFDFSVVISDNRASRYIEIDDNFVILNSGESKNIVARFNGDAPNDVYDKYNFVNSDEGVVSVRQTQNIFTLVPMDVGQAVISITNEYSDFPREVLVMVEKAAVIDLKKYITTSQNVIYMEVDGEAVLTMTLVGGNESDRDGFEWEVSDYTLLEATTTSGQNNVQDSVFEAKAFLKAKKAGTAVIRVEHEKAEYDCTVLVKIFKKGTFGSGMVSLAGPSMFKVRERENYPVSVSLLSGKIEDAGILAWKTDNPGIASAEGGGMFGTVAGVAKGVTSLRVDGENVLEPYEALVVVTREGESDDLKYMYIDNAVQRMYAGQTAVVPIHHPNIPINEFRVKYDVFEGNGIIYAALARDALVISALNEGTCSIKIYEENGLYENDVSITVIVEGHDLNPDKPYTITGENFVGIVKGQSRDYSVSIVGTQAQESGIIWSLDNTDIAGVQRQSGGTVTLIGIEMGQAYIQAQHAKANNVKKAVVYVVDEPAQLNNIVIGAEKTNYIINPGETVYLKLITNATEMQKRNLAWSQDNLDSVFLQTNFDSAVFTGVEPGTCKITVRKAQGEINGVQDNTRHVVPLDIYVTVRDKNAVSDIGLPSSVALLVNERKVIKPAAVGLDDWELAKVEWVAEDPVVSLLRSGNEVIVVGEMKGQTFINVSYGKINLFKRILVVCADSEEELSRMYWFSTDKSLFRIEKDERVTVNLIFGATGFPEDKKQLIEWNDVTGNGVVDILSGARGPRVTIAGKNEGWATVRIEGGGALKPVEIQVEVTDRLVSGQSKFMYKGMHILDKNVTVNIPISLYIGEWGEYEEDGHTHQTYEELETGYAYIETDNENPDIVEAAMVGRALRVRAKEYGKAVVTLRHRDVRDDARLTIVVSDDANALKVAVRKTHYLVDVGNSFELELEASHIDEARLAHITWDAGSTDVIEINNLGRLKAEVRAVREGNAVLNIRVSGVTQETVYISVRRASRAAQYAVSTESVITMLTGYSHFTHIIVSGEGAGGFLWNVDEKYENIVSVSGNNKSAYIEALSAGNAEITVSDGLVSRTIVVVVRNTREELERASLLNIDRRSYRIALGETVILQPYYMWAKPSYGASFNLRYDNNVIGVKKEGGRAEITGRNEGIEILTVANEGCENTAEIVIEVTSLRAEVGSNVNMVYMTTDDNVVLMNTDDGETVVRIGTVGGYLGGEADFKWKANNNLIKITAFGSSAVIAPTGRNGETEITVTNAYCDNELKILVNVNEQYVKKEYTGPYIWTEKTVYSALLTDDAVIINYELRNIEGVTLVGENRLEVQSLNDVVSVVSVKKSEIVASIGNIGTGVITISHSDDRVVNTVKVYILVSSSGENSAVYLTTAQNYVIVQKSKSTTVNVNMVGYNELNSDNIMWSSENNSVAYIVGGGFAAQVHGVDIGVTTIWVDHKTYGRSMNRLKIVVKVVAEGTYENLCYLTTGDNVIETYISSLNNQIIVNKVGGSGYVHNVTWTVDNPSVVQVMGTGLTAYFSAKKEGQALVTVAEAEAQPLEIRIIVRKAKAGTEYIVTADPIIMMAPSGGSRSLKVELIGGTEQDNKNFEWSIYDQSPSDVRVAQAGGSVISLYANGPDASVASMYPGRARIRVKHPKANEQIFIVVLVTQYNNLSFSDTNKTMLRGEHEFVSLNIPNYENMLDKLEVTTSNADIVTVTHAGQMILLSASVHNFGNAMITARIKNSDLMAQLPVIVQEAIPEDEIYITLSDTIITFTPYSPGKIVKGMLKGGGLTASDADNLKWEILNNYGGTVFPQPQYVLTFPVAQVVTTPPPDAKKIDTFYGQTVQIAPNVNADYSIPPYVLIRVSDKEGRTMRTKNMLVHISEQGSSFTLNKALVRFEPGTFETVEATIAGGASKDYDDIEWYLERDFYNPYKESVRIMGQGKSVQVFGIANGESKLVALHRGKIAECKVVVESQQFFEINFELYRMYPGEESLDANGEVENAGFFAIPFTVRPPDANIRWYVTDDPTSPKISWYPKYPSEGAKWELPRDCVTLSHRDKDGSHKGSKNSDCRLNIGNIEGTLKEPNTGYLYVKPLKEGNVIVTGNYGQFVSSVDLIIAYNFTAYFTPMRLEEKILKMGTTSNGSDKVDKATVSASYSMFPPNSFLKLENAAYWEQRGVQVRVDPVDKKTGKGEVSINCFQEVYNLDEKSSDKYATLTFGQYVRENGVEKGTGKTAELKILAMYRNGEQRVIPVFQRVFGTYGNRGYIGSDGMLDNRGLPYAGNVDGNNVKKPDNKRFINAPNSQNGYWKTDYPTTGGIYNEGEWLRQTGKSQHADGKNNNYSGGDSDTYDLVIGDGEEHYIMFDPAVSNMDYEIVGVDVNAINVKTANNGNRGPSMEVIKDEKGKIAGIRVSGGKDFVAYTNVGSMYDLETEITCEKPNTGKGWSFNTGMLATGVLPTGSARTDALFGYDIWDTGAESLPLYDKNGNRKFSVSQKAATHETVTPSGQPITCYNQNGTVRTISGTSYHGTSCYSRTDFSISRYSNDVRVVAVASYTTAKTRVEHNDGTGAYTMVELYLGDCDIDLSKVYDVDYVLPERTGNNKMSIKLVAISREPGNATTLAPTHPGIQWGSCSGVKYFGAGKWRIYRDSRDGYEGFKPPYPLICKGDIAEWAYDWGDVGKTVWRPMMADNGDEFEFGEALKKGEGNLNNKIKLYGAEQTTQTKTDRKYESPRGGKAFANFFSNDTWGDSSRDTTSIMMGNIGFKAWDTAFERFGGREQADYSGQIRRADSNVTLPLDQLGFGGQYFIYDSGVGSRASGPQSQTYQVNLNEFDGAVYASSGVSEIQFVSLIDGLVKSWKINAEENSDRVIIEGLSGVNLANSTPVRHQHVGRVVSNPADKTKIHREGGPIEISSLNNHAPREGRLYIGSPMACAVIESRVVRQTVRYGSNFTQHVSSNGITLFEENNDNYEYLQDKRVYLDFKFRGFVKNQYKTADFFPVIGNDRLSEFPFGFKIELNNVNVGDPGYDERKLKRYASFDVENMLFDDDTFITRTNPDGFDEAEFEKIKGTHIFFPVATKESGIVKSERNYGRIVVKYDTARGPKQINIDVHYETRATTASFNPINKENSYIKAPAYWEMKNGQRVEYIQKINDRDIFEKYGIRLDLYRKQWTEAETRNLDIANVGSININGLNPATIGMGDAFLSKNNNGEYSIDVDY